jgi:hypothetical protein
MTKKPLFLKLVNNATVWLIPFPSLRPLHKNQGYKSSTEILTIFTHRFCNAFINAMLSLHKEFSR